MKENIIAKYNNIAWTRTKTDFYIYNGIYCDRFPLSAFESARQLYNSLVPESEAIPFF